MNFVLCYVCVNIHRLHSDDRSHIIEDILLAQILHSQFNNAKRDVRSKNLTTFGGRERERKVRVASAREIDCRPFIIWKVYWKSVHLLCKMNEFFWDATESHSGTSKLKQRNSYKSSLTFLCFENPTARVAFQHNLFRAM